MLRRLERRYRWLQHGNFGQILQSLLVTRHLYRYVLPEDAATFAVDTTLILEDPTCPLRRDATDALKSRPQLVSRKKNIRRDLSDLHQSSFN